MMGYGYTGRGTLQITGRQHGKSRAADEYIDLVLRNKRDQYWAMLRRAREDFKKIVSPKKYGPDPYAFSHYLQDIYGIRPELDGYSNYTGDYTILDEKKYLLFLLKYGS
jgi:hypothetical protein